VTGVQLGGDGRADAFRSIEPGRHLPAEHERGHAADALTHLLGGGEGQHLDLRIARIRPEPPDLEPGTAGLELFDEGERSYTVWTGARVHEVEVDDRLVAFGVMP
jgi:hypothetical protein